MRIIKRLIYAALAILAACVALGTWLIGPTTLRLMDTELLVSLPAGIIQASKPPLTLAEREATGGPLRYTEKFIPGAAGDPPVRIVIVEPMDATPARPGLLDIHGGGFMYGSPESSLTSLVEGLVRKLGITVVSVDYRLAPGTRYPGALNDNYAALQWFHTHAEDMGVDPRRIGIVGFSAGGAHAAALALHARDRGEVPILFQALLSPALDDRTGSTIDPGPSRGLFLWKREDNRKAWTTFLGVEAGSDQVPAGAVPMRASDLSRLPPAYIAVGSLDLFATESEGYARKLEAAGVPVEVRVFPGGFHGFEPIIPSAGISQRSMHALEAYMARMFGLDKTSS